MQAVILAAGRGTRMDELTTARPKAMLDLLGKPLLEYKFDAMPDEVDEVILIVGYLAHVVRAYFGDEFAGRKITYLEQGDLNGTAGALWRAQGHLKDRFIVMMGDDVYAAADLAQCVQVDRGWAVLVEEIAEMHRAGSVELDEQAHVVGIVEGDKGVDVGLACTNVFSLDTRIFSQPMVPKQEGSLEFGLPQSVIAAARALDITISPVFTVDWLQINAPADLVRARNVLAKRTEEAKKAALPKGAGHASRNV